MIAYCCKLCGAWVIPGVSVDDLADHLLWGHEDRFWEYENQEHLMCSIDWLDYFQQLDGVKVFKVWRPEQCDRIYLVFARSEAEALERCRRGEAEYYHSPCREHLWGNWKELSGTYVWMDENLNQGYEEVQVYEGEYFETPGGTCGEGHVGVPGI